MGFRSHWSNLTWRTLRMASFVTSAITLSLLITALSGVSWWRLPLTVAVAASVIVYPLLLSWHYGLRDRPRRSSH